VVNGSPGLGNQGTLAVSPEGTKLAVASDTSSSGTFNRQGYSERIIVIDLLTGKQSTWQGGIYRAGKVFSVQDVSWSADGQSIVFLAQWCTGPITPCTGAYGPNKGRDAQVRSLSVASGGGTLDSGTLLLAQSAAYPVIAAAIAGPDGSDITAVVLAGQVNSIEHISAVSGSLIGVDYRTSRPHESEGTPDDVSLTADPSGRYLLFSYQGSSGIDIGWIGRGAIHSLPGGQNPGPWAQAW
jgi:Tol biopolymer transport system component